MLRRARLVPWAAWTAISLMGCAHRHPGIEEIWATPNVPTRPGVVSWSPDSNALAIALADRIHVVHLDRRSERDVARVQPVYLDWAPAREILAVVQSDSERQLVRVDPVADRAPVAMQAELRTGLRAARWTVPGVSAVVLVASVRPMSIGTAIGAQLYSVGAGGEKPVLAWDTMLPRNVPGDRALDAWDVLGRRPVHGTLVVPEAHHPPRFPAFVLFRDVDPVAGAVSDLGRFQGQAVPVVATWASNGSLLAWVDDQGQLWSTGMDGSQVQVSTPARGWFPAFHPRSDLLFLGGSVIGFDGSVKADLVDAIDAVGVWSPDGERLAVLAEGGLAVYQGFAGRMVSPPWRAVEAKLERLRGLLAEGLISKELYLSRKQILLSRTATVTP